MKQIAVLTLLAAVAAASAQNTFHGNNARSRVYESPGPKQLGGVKWAFKAGGPIVTSPAIADGVVYIADLGRPPLCDRSGNRQREVELQVTDADRVLAGRGGDTLYFVSSAGSLAALDLKTGQPKWVYAIEYERKFEAKNLHGLRPRRHKPLPDAWDMFTSSPAVANGKVYFGSGDGNVYAVDAQTGARCCGNFNQGCRPFLACSRKQHRLYRELGQLSLRH